MALTKTKITNIEYIVHPTFDINIRPKETKKVIEGIIGVAQSYVNESSRLFILETNGFAHFGVPVGSWYEHNEAISEHFRENANLIDDLSLYCKHLLIVPNKERLIGRDGGDESTLDRFLERRLLALDERILITGHGMYKEGCLSHKLYSLAREIKSRYGKIVEYDFNRLTTLEVPIRIT